MMASSVALLSVEPTQCRAVTQQDPAPLWHLDRRRIFQMLECARNGFDGEPEIIGDVLTRHRQLDGPAAGHAVRHFQKKARDPLLRALDQHQRMLLHTSEFAGGQLPHLAGDIIVPCRTVLRLITIILQSVIASAENVCSSPVSKPKMSPGRWKAPIWRRPSTKTL